ncbi:MAG: DUF1499 domain-containing protein [Pseudomonadota bacterium]
MFLIILLGILALGGYLAYTVQTVTHDPAVWHVDPLEVPPSDTPNSFRIAIPEFTEHPVDLQAPIYAVDAITLSRAFDTFVIGQPRVERVAGTPEEGWLTYVQRTPQLQLPDYISARFYNLEDTGQSTLAIYSRSRFGYGDLGVNGARVRAWLGAIDSFVDEEATEAARAASEAAEPTATAAQPTE